MVIDLIRRYVESKNKVEKSKKTIAQLETELAKVILEPKVSNLNSEPGGGFTSDKILNKVRKKQELELQLDQEQEVFKIYERQYNSIRTEIIDLYKEYEEDKNSTGKEKNMFYVFYYRMFKKYIVPFERIADMLNITPDWVKKIDKEISKSI